MSEVTYGLVDESISTKVLQSILAQSPPPSREDLRRLGATHSVTQAIRSLSYKALLELLRSHVCTEICLAEEQQIQDAGYTSQRQLLACDVQDRKTRLSALRRNKRARIVNSPEAQTQSEWPQVLTSEQRLEIVKSYEAAVSPAALARTECSFCGAASFLTSVTFFPVSELDISVLEHAVELIRNETGVKEVTAFEARTVKDGKFCVCETCRRNIRGRKPAHYFDEIPQCAYANGTFTGTFPFTLFQPEELMIAKARCTTVAYKFKPGDPTSQRYVAGNVCLLPQEPKYLLNILPPPLADLQQDITVILVSSGTTTVTADMLKKSQIIVRRNVVRAALLWLKEYNPIYHDIVISEENLQQYPENDAIDVPTSHRFMPGTANAEGASYASAQTDLSGEGADVPFIQPVGIFDLENVNRSLRERKATALASLLEGKSEFIRYPSGSTPLSPSQNPKVWAYLWPTLFPYGIGYFNDPIRRLASGGFKQLDQKTQVIHFLTRTNTAFATHFQFPFVIFNYQQVRASISASYLAVNRQWFPQVEETLKVLTDNPQAVSDFAEKLRKDPKAKAETELEKRATKMMRFIDFISYNITGSRAHMTQLREEIRATTMEEGVATFFVTINPSDTNNPIAQIFAGKECSLEHILSNPKEGNGYARACAIANNPVAGAQFFDHTITNLLKYLVGDTAPGGKPGLFGKARAYYGVVEAQSRGSLHLHIEIWIEGALSPSKMREKAAADPEWRKQLINYYESIIHHDFPDTVEKDFIPTVSPVLRTMVPTSTPDYESARDQDLYDLLRVTGQVHTHGFTCFKYLPHSVSALRDDDRDCRFNLPAPIIEKSYFDEATGRIELKRTNGSMNGYNPVIVSLLRCNVDCKFIQSGTAGEAMFHYISGYITKSPVDLSIMYTALSLGLKKTAIEVEKRREAGIEVDAEEISRMAILKSSNTMLGKSELSGQQTVSKLLNKEDHYASKSYENLYITKVLCFFAPELCWSYGAASQSKQTVSGAEEEGSDGEDEDEDEDEHDPSNELLSLGDRLRLNVNSSSAALEAVPITTIIEDYVYRSDQLESYCLWDFVAQVEKVKKGVNYKATAADLLFSSLHSQHKTHMLQMRRKGRVTPVPIGAKTPRKDAGSDEYYAYMLCLFSPWRRVAQVSIDWKQQFEEFEKIVDPRLAEIIENSQAFYQCRDAADDWGAQRKANVAELRLKAKEQDYVAPKELTEFDVELELMNEGEIELDDEEIEAAYIRGSDLVALESITVTEKSEFYKVNQIRRIGEEGTVSIGGRMEILEAKKAEQDLLSAKKLFIAKRARDRVAADDARKALTNEFVPLPEFTTLEKEGDTALRYHEHLRHESGLFSWQQLAIDLIEKYNFNSKQRLAFLIVADHAGRESLKLNPGQLCFLLAGPGGTGKSRIFDAIKEFYTRVGFPGGLKVTAPTGVAAVNIGGSTIHSEASLMVKKVNHADLQERWEGTKTLLVDEISMVGSPLLGELAINLKIAQGDASIDHLPFAGYNVILAGDVAQLQPVKQVSLFAKDLIQEYTALNPLNKATLPKLIGFSAWRQVEKVVMLDEIHRQKDPIFIDILQHARFGLCTSEHINILKKRLVQNLPIDERQNLYGIERWAEFDEEGQTLGCPLITGSNTARDAHNIQSMKAFALATGQEYHEYVAKDTSNRKPLLATIRRSALAAPAKQASDLMGRLPLVVGAPYFVTYNLATELGICNGAEARLVSVSYELNEYKERCVISCVVDIPSFSHGKDPAFPHRVRIKPIRGEIKYRIAHAQLQEREVKGKEYTGQRLQVPLLPAFAFTSYNSQGRTLERGCIDLASAKTAVCPLTR